MTLQAKERPILFSAPMVRAILAGQKTQTRRVMKLHPSAIGCCCGGDAAQWRCHEGEWYCGVCGGGGRLTARSVAHARSPYGQPGDRLWVRETHAIVPRTAYRCSEGVQQVLRPDDDHDAAIFRATFDRSGNPGWKPSIHMPRWASRITLEITDVRVERLSAISESDATSEGVQAKHTADADYSARDAFRVLWQSINGDGSWDADPWVWVVSFTPRANA